LATIKEISEKVGVSIATVSKVLNGQSGVSTKTQKKVQAVAKELNYRPNLNARHLKTGNSRTLGIITEDLTVFNTPKIVDGIGVSCDERDYHYILGNLRFNKRFGHNPIYAKEKEQLVQSVLDDMLSKQVDGILYVGCHSHAVAYLKPQDDIRFVCMYCFSEEQDIPSVNYNDREAAKKVAEFLISKGHRNIGVLAGDINSLHTNNRLLGFQEALYESNIPYNPNLTSFGEWEREHGYQNTQRLIEAGATAIFAHNDLIAIGVIDYCNQNRIEIGKELDLVGFDNREIADVCRPKLTTVNLPLFEIGRSAANIMLDMIEKKYIPEKHDMLMSCSIIERDSTG
jgi:DNA-binding LacI/PurR family transcriptional regulator